MINKKKIDPIHLLEGMHKRNILRCFRTKCTKTILFVMVSQQNFDESFPSPKSSSLWYCGCFSLIFISFFFCVHKLGVDIILHEKHLKLHTFTSSVSLSSCAPIYTWNNYSNTRARKNHGNQRECMAVNWYSGNMISQICGKIDYIMS